MSFIYETTIIFRPELGEDQVNQAIAKFKNILTEHGTSQIDVHNRGKRRLAYEINRHRDGIYVQLNYPGKGSQIAVLERAFRLSEDVIRYLTIKQEVPKPKVEAAEA